MISNDTVTKRADELVAGDVIVVGGEAMYVAAVDTWTSGGGGFSGVIVWPGRLRAPIFMFAGDQVATWRDGLAVAS